VIFGILVKNQQFSNFPKMVAVCILKLNLVVVSVFVSLHAIVEYRITAKVQKYGIWLKNVKVYVLSKT